VIAVTALTVVALDAQIPDIDTATCVATNQLRIVYGQVHGSDALFVDERSFAGRIGTALLSGWQLCDAFSAVLCHRHLVNVEVLAGHVCRLFNLINRNLKDWGGQHDLLEHHL